MFRSRGQLINVESTSCIQKASYLYVFLISGCRLLLKYFYKDVSDADEDSRTGRGMELHAGGHCKIEEHTGRVCRVTVQL